MADVTLLYTTWPDVETAEAAGAAAVEARLAACANVLAPMRSIYRWEGRIEAGTEAVMILKTAAEAAPRLRDFLLARHPYELPCIIALNVDEAASHPAFLAWVQHEVLSRPVVE